MGDIIVGANERKSLILIHDKPVSNERVIRLVGEGASVEVDEVLCSGGVQSKLRIIHEANCTVSKVRSRGVLRDGECSLAHATVVIPIAAQKSKSSVSQRFLLLGKSAQIDAVPSLEIEADDVQATHSTAIVPLDERSLFYLASRGVSRDDAMALMVQGFLNVPGASK